MTFDPGFSIEPTAHPMGFDYGAGTFGPAVELRSLDSIRKSLRDPDCSGPDPVYAIAMDIGKIEHKALLEKSNLLFGAVTYASGRLGDEPVRSQGHVHKKVRGNTMSPPEIYEIWSGKAIIFMQERAEADPGRCFAVEASRGDVVMVPPDWAHATISADPHEPLTFGAWCDRHYAFEYDRVRAQNGLAWFPIVDGTGSITWTPNPSYARSVLTEKKPEDYRMLGIQKGCAIYTTFEREPDALLYVPNPHLAARVWENFIP
jgi:glucose-6-phosphate isomerase